MAVCVIARGCLHGHPHLDALRVDRARRRLVRHLRLAPGHGRAVGIGEGRYHTAAARLAKRGALDEITDAYEVVRVPQVLNAVRLKLHLRAPPQRPADVAAASDRGAATRRAGSTLGGRAPRTPRPIRSACPQRLRHPCAGRASPAAGRVAVQAARCARGPKSLGPVIRKGSASARAVPVASLCQPPVGLLKIGGQRRAARAGALRGGTPLRAVALTRLRAHARDRAARRLSRALQAEWPTKSAGPGSVRARAARVSRGEHAAKPERCGQGMGCASPPLRARRALLGAASAEGSRADRDRRRGD